MDAQGSLSRLAAQLRSLHVPGNPLVVPNIWDAAGALSAVRCGFAAVATSSGAVAESLGFADHEETPAAEMFAAVSRIAARVDVPVTADLESGYRLEPDEFVASMLDAGAVGCNLEDTDHATGRLADPEHVAERLAGVRAAASRAGVDIVINARVDVFITPGVPLSGGAGAEAARATDANRATDSGRITEALERIRLYAGHGADCVYPIGVTDPATIHELVQGSPVPVNIMAVPGWPGSQRARELGVGRVSFGTRIWKSVGRFMEGELQSIRRE